MKNHKLNGFPFGTANSNVFILTDKMTKCKLDKIGNFVYKEQDEKQLSFSLCLNIVTVTEFYS